MSRPTRSGVAQEVGVLMEAEVSGEIGATRGEISAERSTHRNGYRDRGLGKGWF